MLKDVKYVVERVNLQIPEINDVKIITISEKEMMISAYFKCANSNHNYQKHNISIDFNYSFKSKKAMSFFFKSV